MLIGDAASLVDPFSGEGIANAMASAKLAAEQVVQAREAPGAGALRGYEERLWREMGRGMRRRRTGCKRWRATGRSWTS